MSGTRTCSVQSQPMRSKERHFTAQVSDAMIPPCRRMGIWGGHTHVNVWHTALCLLVSQYRKWGPSNERYHYYSVPCC